MQKLQDWFTQQWVILFGRKFNPKTNDWLIGPFGEIDGIGEKFINQLAEKEQLIIQRNSIEKGILNSIQQLNLSTKDLQKLSPNVIDFYINTANYQLDFQVKWNPIFITFGFLVNQLFSRRINQLNVPFKNSNNSESISSEIITLKKETNHETKYTIWLRKFEKSGKIIYSGVYDTCKLPSGETCVKAVFPLPKGNATVILKVLVGEKGELILDSSGKWFEEAGFYFLLNDAQHNFWAKYIRSFRDKLIVYSENQEIFAKQTLTLWNLKVLTFHYKINPKNLD